MEDEGVGYILAFGEYEELESWLGGESLVDFLKQAAKHCSILVVLVFQAIYQFVDWEYLHLQVQHEGGQVFQNSLKSGLLNIPAALLLLYVIAIRK